MKNMTNTKKHTRTGFTLIEISLFIVISAAIFASVAFGIRGSVSRRHYDDAVQDFAQLLRNQYTAVTSVQSNGSGQSNQAIYGRLITFGEEDDDDTIYIYNIIGKALPSDNFIRQTSVLAALEKTEPHIQVENPTNAPKYIPNQISYNPIWESEVQATGGSIFSGSILIVRSPASGLVYTYYTDTVVSVQHQIPYNTTGKIEIFNNRRYKQTGNEINYSSSKIDYRTQSLDFCIYSDDIYTNKRRNIRLQENGHNVTAAQLIPLDSEENAC